MSLRDILTRNLGWKLLSLVLAVVIWVTVKVVSTERGDQVERSFLNLPLQIVSSTADVRAFRVSPVTVDVTVKGRGETIKALTEREIHSFVDASDAEASQKFTRRVEVAVPAGVTIVRVDPTEATVEVRAPNPSFPVNP